MYKFGTLGLGVKFIEENEKMLGKNTLGIEITVENLASKCGLGNIDPQHSGERKSSAIKESLTYPLPPSGAYLVTIRPDRDAFGSMAVFHLRSIGEAIDKELVECVEIVDSMGFKKALASSRAVYERTNELTVMQKIVNGSVPKYTTTEEKVMAIAQMLSGKFSESEINEISAMKHNWKNGKVDFSSMVEMYNGIAFIAVTNRFREARDWANQYYPIAVIFDSEYLPQDKRGSATKRWTIIRQNGYMKREKVEEMLNEAEAKERNISVKDLIQQGLGWGGPKNIVSSPQSEPSKLKKNIILQIVESCI